nr:hypothetical protein [Pedobacter sp. ASV19]
MVLRASVLLSTTIRNKANSPIVIPIARQLGEDKNNIISPDTTNKIGSTLNTIARSF